MLVAALLAYSGFTALCLAISRHHRQLWHRPATSQRALVLRLVGAALLAGSLLASTQAEGMPRGVVAWFGVLPLAALLLVGLLPFSPRTAAVLAVLAPLSALLLV
ncbi:MAG: DUF3325 domain-containing protein [Steroidobacteraceae bacterium]